MTQKVSQRFISDYAVSLSVSGFTVVVVGGGGELLPVGKVKRAEISILSCRAHRCDAAHLCHMGLAA